jgi:hypothetical protein
LHAIFAGWKSFVNRVVDKAAVSIKDLDTHMRRLGNVEHDVDGLLERIKIVLHEGERRLD